MKTLLSAVLGALVFVAAAGILPARADDQQKPKPYTLNTCAVCGMKLGQMEKPVVFVYKDREIKVCDKDEEAQFKKDPAKYVKKIEEAEAKAKK